MQVLRNSEASHQNSFLAIYNMETTEILGFYQVILLTVAQNVMLFRWFCVLCFSLESVIDAFLFEQNSSEELVQLVERYWDHFRVAPQSPLYMNFISSSANNSFAREQFRKEKDACISGKAGGYIQVAFHTFLREHRLRCSFTWLESFRCRLTLTAVIVRHLQVIKRTLASLPHNSQSQSPSAYFDQYLFHYDEKVRTVHY